jgi:uncharacterized membrane protein
MEAEERMKKVAEFVNPALSQEKALSPSRLFYFLLVAFGISYCIFLYGFIKSQVRFLRCEGCRTDFGIWLGLLFYELYFWHKTIGSIPGLNHQITPEMILQIIYPIGMTAFLWRPVMTRIFGIDTNTKRYSLLAGAIISVGLMVLFS